MKVDVVVKNATFGLTISAEQKRLLDLAFAHWVKEGVWPNCVQVKAWLHAEGLDYRTAFSQDLRPLAYTRERERVELELSLFGIAVADSGEPWIKYFIPLVKRGIKVFIQNPRGKPQLTDAHLREVAPSEPVERLRRLSELYKDELISFGGGASHNADGSWQIHLSPCVIRYKNVETISDFLKCKQKVGCRLSDLGQDHRQMALWIYETWREAGKGPTPLDVVLNHLECADPIATWEEMPDGFFTEERLYSDLQRPIEPRLLGLLALRPKTDVDLHAFVAILVAIHDLYFENGAMKPPDIGAVALRANVIPEHVVRLLQLAPSMHVGVLLQKQDGEFQILIDESIFAFDNISTLDEFLAWAAERKKKSDRWSVQPTIHATASIVAPTLTGQEDALHSALAGRNKDLASIYLGVLLTISDGRNPDRFALAAHGLRELMEKLPAYLNVPQPAHKERLGEKIRLVEDPWRVAIKNSKCYEPENNKWRGEIDGPLRSLLVKLSEFFTWMDKHMPRRHAEVSTTLRNLDPVKQHLPSPIEKLNVEQWIKMREFFVNGAHHKTRLSATEFDQWRSALESFLLDRLVPRTFEDFDKIDTIIATG